MIDHSLGSYHAVVARVCRPYCLMADSCVALEECVVTMVIKYGYDQHAFRSIELRCVLLRLFDYHAAALLIFLFSSQH
jgi:hypothetical protein